MVFIQIFGPQQPGRRSAEVLNRLLALIPARIFVCFHFVSPYGTHPFSRPGPVRPPNLIPFCLAQVARCLPGRKQPFWAVASSTPPRRKPPAAVHAPYGSPSLTHAPAPAPPFGGPVGPLLPGGEGFVASDALTRVLIIFFSDNSQIYSFLRIVFAQ